MNDRVATLLLDFARQRGALDAQRYETLRGTLRDADMGRVVDTLRDAGMDVSVVDELLADADAAAHPPVIEGFRILGYIGRGAVGTVWKAQQLGPDRPVALKVIAVNRLADPEALMSEGRALARMNSPHVITCHDVGREGEWCWLALALADGGDCDRVLRKRGKPASSASTLKIGRDLAQGLEDLHAAGLLHRDIKPANALLIGGGRACLGDLGLAQSATATASQRGGLAGTPGYVAPEIARGKPHSVQSDVYALGATLYTLAVGEPPFTAASPAALFARLLSEPSPDPRAKQPALPETVAAIIRRAMAVDPADRYADASAMRSDVEAVLAGRSLAVVTSSTKRTHSGASLVADIRNRWAFITAAVCAGCVGFSMGYWFHRQTIPNEIVYARREQTASAWLAAREQVGDPLWSNEITRALDLCRRWDALQLPPTVETVADSQFVEAEARLAHLRAQQTVLRHEYEKVLVTASRVATAKVALEVVNTPTDEEQPVAKLDQVPAKTILPAAVDAPAPVPKERQPQAPVVIEASPLVFTQLAVPKNAKWVERHPLQKDLLVAFDEQQLWVKRDGQPGWRNWFMKELTTVDINADRCLWISSDGATWFWPSTTSEKSIIGAISRNGGDSWEAAVAPLPAPNGSTLYMRAAMAVDGVNFFVSTYNGSHALRSVNGGKSWQVVSHQSQGYLKIGQTGAGKPLLVNSAQGQLIFSADLGSTWVIGMDFSLNSWTNERDRLWAPSPRGAWFVLGNPVQLIEVGHDGRLLRVVACKIGSDTYRTFAGMDELGAHPTDPNTLYARIGYDTLLRSTDGGKIWWSASSSKRTYGDNLQGLVTVDGRDLLLTAVNATVMDETQRDPAHFPNRADTWLPVLPMGTAALWVLTTPEPAPDSQRVLAQGAEEAKSLMVAKGQVLVGIPGGFWTVGLDGKNLQERGMPEVDRRLACPSERAMLVSDGRSIFVPNAYADAPAGWISERAGKPYVEIPAPPDLPAGQLRTWSDSQGNLLSIFESGSGSRDAQPYVLRVNQHRWETIAEFPWDAGGWFPPGQIMMRPSDSPHSAERPGWMKSGIESTTGKMEMVVASCPITAGVVTVTRTGRVIAFRQNGRAEEVKKEGVLATSLMSLPMVGKGTSLFLSHPKWGVIASADRGKSWKKAKAELDIRAQSPIAVCEDGLVYIDNRGRLVLWMTNNPTSCFDATLID